MSSGLVRAIAVCVLLVGVAPATRVVGAGGYGVRQQDRQHVGRGSVAAGRSHSLIATPDGRVSAWGAGGRGQIGDGELADRWTPVAVPDLGGIVAVTAGAAHTVAVTLDGAVYSWGANTFGRLGDGTRLRRARPVHVAGLTNVTMAAAGGAHTLALTADGHVFAWGRNTNGQLGIGTTVASLAPVQVPGLVDIAAIAAGDSHSLAVTRSGRLFAWGHNQFSMLGDGTTTDRVRPVAIEIRDVVAVAGGASHSLALLRDGSVFSWGRGLNGELGTGSTRVAAAPARIPGLEAAAIAAGRRFSAAVRRDGRVMAWGANESGQLGEETVMRRLRPGVVDGVSSVATIALGAAHAIAVTTAGDVVTWGAGESGQLGSGSPLDNSAPSEIISDIPDWGLSPDGNPAPPAPPDISPGTGIYPQAQMIALAGVRPTDLIRFTLDGSEPTDTSMVYTSPFLLADSATVTARTYSAQGEQSSVRAATFTIDTVAPTIAVSTSPPLGDGWMTTPVTVTFQCADNIAIASCPQPVLVTTDGAAQLISATAVDLAGHQSTASVSLNLDLQPPALAVTEPADRSAIAADVVQVIGMARDLASGLADVRCNGRPAETLDGAVRCSIQLHPGRNDIILHAVDAAGHNASTAISVTRQGAPTALRLTPGARTMILGENALMSLRDDFGAAVDDAAWSSSDDAVVVLSESDPPVLTAVGIGSTTIVADKDGLQAIASIEVRPGRSAGDTRWTVPALPGLAAEPPLFTNRVDASVPEMFTVETERWGEATLRAVSSDGKVLWQQHSPGLPLMGDSHGGVLIGVLSDVNQGSDYRAYLRLGGGTAPAWRYESSGALSRPAQANDGTIYAIEYLFGGVNRDGDEIWDKHAVMLEGATGRVIGRTLLRREVDEFVSDRDGVVIPLQPPLHCRSLYYDYAPETVGPVVGGDGRGYLIVRRHEVHKQGGCTPPFQSRPDRLIDMGLDLVVLSPTASPQTIPLFSTSCVGTEGTVLPCDLPVRAFQVMPDGIGGTLVTWERGTRMAGRAVVVERSLTRINAGGGLDERLVAPQFWLEMIGQNGTAITFDDGWKAIDVTTGEVRWASPLTDLAPLAARPDGGLAALDLTSGELQLTAANGAVQHAQPFGLHWSAVHRSDAWIGVRGNALTAVLGDFDDATRFSALDLTTRQQRVRMPGVGIWLKTHSAFGPAPFQHSSLRVTPFNQDWLLANRSMFENCVPESSCLPLGEDVFGNRFFTIGAGTGEDDTNIQCNGLLTKGFNRPKDISAVPAQPLLELPIEFSLQPTLIGSLLERFGNYADQLGYYCFPEERPGFYNSNSFIHGLLHAASVSHDETPPTLLPVPGWLTAVPMAAFDPRQ